MTLDLRPLTNRSADGRFTLPADGWWHLVPVGEYPHRESGLLQVLDRPALTEMVNRFEPGTLVDFDHFSYDPAKSSEAAGWIDQVELRDDGIWAKARWSDLGQAALVNGRYRFSSPVWLPSDLERLDGNRVRPRRLDTAGLTNQPNLRGMAPITNRLALSDDPSGPANPKQSEAKSMKSVATRLGLQADASEEAVRAAVDVVITERDALKTEVGPLKNRATEAETKLKAARETQATADFEPFKARIPESAHAHWREQLMANRDATLATLQSLGEPKAEADVPVLKNRGTPAAKPETGDKAKAFLGKVDNYRIANRCSYDDAFGAVARKEPELAQAALAR